MTNIVRVGVATFITSALAFTAQAADMRRPVYRAPAAAVFSWTGCYAGGQLGGQWAHASVGVNYPGDAIHGPVAASRDFNSDGRFLYGGQIGCNWQQPGSTVVWGVEGDLAGINRGDTDIVRSGTQGSARLRAGLTVDRTLFYVAGGWSRARLDATHSVFADGSLIANSSTTRDGWNVGVGAEYAWVNNWTIGAEYRFTDYGSFTRNVPAGSAGTVTWVPFTVSTNNLRTSDVRLRLNYLFGGPAGYRY